MTTSPFPPTTLTVPRAIATCPYCGCGLTVEVTGEVLDEEQGRWYADQVQIDFDSEPPMGRGDGRWDSLSGRWWDWHDGHSQMPYVNMLPIDGVILKWINEQRYPPAPGLDVRCPNTLELFG